MKTLAEAWQKFALHVIPSDAPTHQRESMKMAFFAGAAVAYEECTIVVGAADLSEDDGVKHLRALDAELQQFAKQMRAKA